MYPTLLIVIGIATHLVLLRRVDSVEYAPKLALAVSFGPAVLFLGFCLFTLLTLSEAIVQSTIWYFSFMFGVLASMMTYRLFFHRLRNYPGPFLARLTQWYYVWKVGPKQNQHWYLEQLHKQYGEYVRIGPNTISIAEPAIVDIVFGPSTKFVKNNWYHMGLPLTSLQQMTDPHLHDRRRKHGWDKAFSTISLRSYDRRIMKYTGQLMEQLADTIDQEIDIMTWLGYFAFDFMGDLAFGTSFDALNSGKSHWWMQELRDNNFFFGVFGTVPWFLDLLLRIPIPDSMNGMKRVTQYSDDLVEQRKRTEPAEPDVMSHILEEGPFFDDEVTDSLLLKGDARLLVIAGSDTTTATLTFASYYLARDPAIADKIREELSSNGIDAETLSVPALTHLPYLNAVINEVLRLHPPVPSGVYRNPPKNGTVVNGHFVPEGCIVFSPQHVIQRSRKAYVSPLDFIPERWTTRPELILNKHAFYPFSLGKYGCIGKQLAYNEVRTVISMLMLNFDIKFAAGEDGSKLLYENVDQFTIGVRPLRVVLQKR